MPGVDGEAVCCADQAAEVVEVFPGRQRDLVGLDAAAEVFDVLRGNRHHAAPGQAAAVDQIARDVQVQALPGNQRARAVEVAFLHTHVDLRHQHVAGFAAGEGDFFLHQPDDVAGQLGHLLGRQFDTRHQLPLIGEGDGVIDQRPVLRFVVGVAIKETSAGELRDLFANQFLFIEAIAKTLLGQGWVDLQAFQHVIRRQPGAIAGETRISFDQVVAGGLRVGGEQAVVWQFKGRTASANLLGHALGVLGRLRRNLDNRCDLKGSRHGCADGAGGRDLLADRLSAARADLGACAADYRVLREDGRLQGYFLNQRGRGVGCRVRALPVAALALHAVKVGNSAAVDGRALARQFGVGQAGHVGLQQPAGDDATLVVEHIARADLHRPARQDLRRCRGGDLGFVHHAGVVVAVPVVALALRGDQVIHLVVAQRDLVGLIAVGRAGELKFLFRRAADFYVAGAEVFVGIAHALYVQRQIAERFDGRTGVGQ
ncbi:RTX toxin [Pseudomonas syringae pv. cilantro]|uniref:RTX toxin n=1 Tax=Pseudomonas syringae pv. cilantro TaxID=81035 RepID=A0A0N0X723_PSESX|nr:RTX toxin [Pseudomonas syringae pv. cilantro]